MPVTTGIYLADDGALHVLINGKPTQQLATVKLTDPATARWDLATALRSVAAELERQHLEENFER